jgi:26 proteasome complex subunit DSS1
MADLVAGKEWLLLTFLYYAEWDDKEEGNEAVQQWEDDWDDDDVNDDFSLQLRKELEGSNAQKS